MRPGPLPLVLFLALQACVLVPIAEDEPYRNERLTSLDHTSSTRADVLFAFGEPTRLFDRERVFIYETLQSQALLVLFSLGVSFETLELLVAEFDDAGRSVGLTALSQGSQVGLYASPFVSHADLAESTACVPSGLCIELEQGVAVAPSPRDQDAKGFLPGNGYVLYVFREIVADVPEEGLEELERELLAFGVDDRTAGVLMDGGFYRVEASPGVHNNVVWRTAVFAGRPRLIKPLARTALRCAAGELHFVRLGGGRGFRRSEAVFDPITMSVTSQEQGRRAIEQRKLLLPRF